jgi:hypothetical protein
VDACDRVNAAVVVFLPSDLPGREHLLAAASDVYLITDTSSDSSRVPPAGIGDRLRGVLVPPFEVRPDAQDEAPNDVDDFGFIDVEPSVSESDAEALPGMDLDPAFQDTEVEDRPTELDPISDEETVHAPRVEASRSRVLVLLLVVALMGLVAAVWYGVVEIPWLSSGLPE